jgi:hypothetical protein
MIDAVPSDARTQATRRVGPRLVRALRLAFLLAAVGLSGYAVATRWEEVVADLGQIGPLRSLLSVPPMLGGLYCGMRAWRAVLAGLGSALRPRDAARIYFLGQLGKYLPGAVWPALAQMELGRDYDVPRRRSVGALVIAVVTSITTGLIVAAVTVPFVAGHRYPASWWLLAPVPLLAVLMSPRILLACLRRLPLLDLRSALPAVMPAPAMVGAVAWTMLGWMCYGAHVAVLAAAFPSAGTGPLVIASLGGYPLAWAAGMVAILLPAGAGARDVALVLTLSVVVPTNSAIAVAVVSRAVSTGCDLFLAGGAAVGAGPAVRRRVAAARGHRAAIAVDGG